MLDAGVVGPALVCPEVDGVVDATGPKGTVFPATAFGDGVVGAAVNGLCPFD